jgi:hypothetical protein
MTEPTPTLPINPAQERKSLSQADAAQKRVELTAAWRAENPSSDLSPELAEQKLAAMAEAYRKANPERLSARDAALVGHDQPPRPFETTRGGKLSLRNTLKGIEDLRELNIPDEGISRILKGDWTPEDRAWAAAEKRRLSAVEAACSPMERRFVHWLMNLPPKRGCKVQALKLAGYGKRDGKPSTPHVLNSIAQDLLNRQRVADLITE